MLGIRFMKTAPTHYVLHYQNGRVRRAGAGLAFFYYAPVASIVCVPVQTMDLPFIFNEVTADFQTITVQGHLSYRITDPQRLAALLNYTVNPNGTYTSDDPAKLGERLIYTTQAIARGLLQRIKLQENLLSAENLVALVLAELKQAAVLAMHGVEVVGLSIISMRPTPEMAKALEAETREAFQRKADEAIYDRRNAAVEQERKIKESELNTELAVEGKRRQIRESQMEADIAVEQQRAVLIDQKVANQRKEADSRSYALEKTMAPLRDLDWRTLMAVTSGGINSGHIIAMAFKELAEHTDKIGELNITPELLRSLVER